MQYRVLAFYHLVPLSDPHELVARHHAFFQDRDIRSRIYISEEGINGQMSASAAHADEYMDWLRADPRFADVRFKLSSASEHAFPKTAVRVRQLVAIDCEVDLSSRGEAVPPAEWKKMLEEKGEETLLIDVRNDYEWTVGHFEGAEKPMCDSFREFPAYAKQLKETKDLKKTRVMMYCTGGIRCEFYSALLKQEGFEQVYQLEGGVIEYGIQEGSKHWKGKLFVFDDRLVAPISDDEAPPISACKYCGASSDVYYNCANMDCNDLFLCCVNCLKAHRGCCSDGCIQEGRVRPYREDGSAKPFRKWDYHEKLALRKCQN